MLSKLRVRLVHWRKERNHVVDFGAVITSEAKYPRNVTEMEKTLNVIFISHGSFCALRESGGNS